MRFLNNFSKETTPFLKLSRKSLRNVRQKGADLSVKITKSLNRFKKAQNVEKINFGKRKIASSNVNQDNQNSETLKNLKNAVKSSTLSHHVTTWDVARVCGSHLKVV